MCAAPSSRTLLKRQRLAVERLRSQLAEADGSRDHPYFRPLSTWPRSAGESLDAEELAEVCASRSLVYVGDYHAVPGYQTYTAELLRRLASRRKDVILGVEFVFTRQQRTLDHLQSGLLTDEEFRQRIHYRDDWGYPWEGFGALLSAARECDVPVLALDTPPRRGLGGLKRRDDHAARRIVSILRERPDACLMVFFGESHLAPAHLPRRVQARLGRAGLEADGVTVLQNPDPLYWKLVAEGRQLDRPVRVDESTYAVFHLSPLQKYEAYRQVLERWAGDVPSDEEVDLTPAVHHLVGVLLGWLGIRADRHRLNHQAGWAEDLEDAFPEVYAGPEATELLGPILEEYGRVPEEIDEARRLLEARGALFDPRCNAMFLSRYVPGRAAGEAARFLRAALTGRLFIANDDYRGHLLPSVYGAAYNEALAYLGARLVDPATDYLLGSPGEGEGVEAPGPEVRGVLAAHREFEQGSRRVALPAALRKELEGSRRLRRAAARDIGDRLGRRLLEQVRQGSLDRRRLRHLFSRPVSPVRAARIVLGLLREPRESVA
ncbi:hypothetical protein ABI59_05680 [Acidobacteria bacterium Mor1]|nr:hypothetical protein ABI59_05680 [Acidobacteria bacterium Mor1]